MTNGDWIRSLTDEGLALFIYQNSETIRCVICSEKYPIKVFREFLSSEHEDIEN